MKVEGWGMRSVVHARSFIPYWTVHLVLSVDINIFAEFSVGRLISLLCSMVRLHWKLVEFTVNCPRVGFHIFSLTEIKSKVQVCSS